jgi:hypothetical protein
MGQRRVRKANFQPFESSSENSPYVRITKNMINSPAWQELNCFEQTLYLHMKFKYNGKPGGEKDISFTYKEGEKLMSKRVFTRSMDKLIEVGLIDLVKHMPYSSSWNIYGLSDRWHDYGTPEFMIKTRPKRSSGNGKSDAS